MVRFLVLLNGFLNFSWKEGLSLIKNIFDFLKASICKLLGNQICAQNCLIYRLKYNIQSFAQTWSWCNLTKLKNLLYVETVPVNWKSSDDSWILNPYRFAQSLLYKAAPFLYDSVLWFAILKTTEWRRTRKCTYRSGVGIHQYLAIVCTRASLSSHLIRFVSWFSIKSFLILTISYFKQAEKSRNV